MEKRYENKREGKSQGTQQPISVTLLPEAREFTGNVKVWTFKPRCPGCVHILNGMKIYVISELNMEIGL